MTDSQIDALLVLAGQLEDHELAGLCCAALDYTDAFDVTPVCMAHAATKAMQAHTQASARSELERAQLRLKAEDVLPGGEIMGPTWLVVGGRRLELGRASINGGAYQAVPIWRSWSEARRLGDKLGLKLYSA